MIRLGTRGSALARWQADHIAGHLRTLGHPVEIEVIVTAGDRLQNAPFVQVGDKGIFTREIEEALDQHRIDIAVHSLKDLASELPPQFTIGCVPPRADPRDAFVSAKYAGLQALPAGAVIGTSSIRRQALLRNLRPDVRVRELRGNVDTRLRKLESGEYDAIILAAAGLERLGLTRHIRGYLSAEQMCPAPGQGALGIECRASDSPTQIALKPMEDRDARFAVTLERAAVAVLEGGCHAPVGLYCSRVGAAWRALGVVARPDGTAMIREEMLLNTDRSDPDTARDGGRQLAAALLARGARRLLDEPEANPRPDSTP